MTSSTVHDNPSRVRAAQPAAVGAAIVAAAGFATEGVISLVHSTGDRHWDTASQILNLAFALACLALVVALPAVGNVLRPGRLGRGGIVAAQLGFAAMTIESVASSVHAGQTLGGLFFGGLILALAGQLVLGVDAARRPQLRWAALLPFLGMFVAIAGGDHGGSIVLAAIWVILATVVARSQE
jgi:hypothetical protein